MTISQWDYSLWLKSYWLFTSYEINQSIILVPGCMPCSAYCTLDFAACYTYFLLHCHPFHFLSPCCILHCLALEQLSLSTPVAVPFLPEQLSPPAPAVSSSLWEGLLPPSQVVSSFLLFCLSISAALHLGRLNHIRGLQGGFNIGCSVLCYITP